ncbi:MAG: hypothetical protein SGI86_15280 [Deltaproteobacteria bacterium]|nr:hypothetical protein [Deltaproteobacteria bacterium]
MTTGSSGNGSKALVRDVLGDAGDGVARVERFKVARDLRVRPGAVNA